MSADAGSTGSNTISRAELGAYFKRRGHDHGGDAAAAVFDNIRAHREASEAAAAPAEGSADPALRVGASFDAGNLRPRLEAVLDASIDRCARCKVCDNQIDAVMTILGPLLERAVAAEGRLAELENAVTELAPAPLTSAQCDALRRLVAEHQEAVSAVRRALDLTAALDGADREIIAAGRAGLKVLEGDEEEADHA